MNEFEIVQNLPDYKNLESQIAFDKFFHAHIFICEDDWTSKNLSLVLSILLLNGNYDEDKAKVCSRTHPDVLIYGEKSSILTKDSDDICQQTYIAPMLAKNKVFILLGFDNATEQSQNKLLKTFEEPQSNTFFILCAKNEDKILKTIRSRCKVVYLQRTPIEVAKQILGDLPLENFDGYFGSVLSKEAEKDSEYALVAKKIVFDLKSSKQLLDYANFFTTKEVSEKLLQKMQGIYEKCLIIKTKSCNLYDDDNLDLKMFATSLTINSLKKILQKISDCQKILRQNVNLQLAIDNLLLTILEEKYIYASKTS